MKSVRSAKSRIGGQPHGGVGHADMPALQRHIEALERSGKVIRASVRVPWLVVWAKRGAGVKSPLDGKYPAFVCRLRAEYELMREVIRLPPLAKRILWNRVPELAAGAFPVDAAQKLAVLQRVLRVLDQIGGAPRGGFGNALKERRPTDPGAQDPAGKRAGHEA